MNNTKDINAWKDVTGFANRTTARGEPMKWKATARQGGRSLTRKAGGFERQIHPRSNTSSPDYDFLLVFIRKK